MNDVTKVVLGVAGLFLLFIMGVWLGVRVDMRDTREADRACVVSLDMQFTWADTLDLLYWYKGGRPECIHWIKASRSAK